MEKSKLDKIRDNYKGRTPEEGITKDDLDQSKKVIAALQEKQRMGDEPVKNDEASRDDNKEEEKEEIIDTKDEDFEMEEK